jgi:hypothetical protein
MITTYYVDLVMDWVTEKLFLKDFSPKILFGGIAASSTNKTGRRDIGEISLKVALNTINQIKSTISTR